MAQDAGDTRALAVRGAAWSAVDKWTARVLTLVTFAILGRLLGPEPFGVVAAATVAVTLLAIISNSILMPALVLERQLDETTRATAFWLSAFAAALATGVLVAIAPLVSRIFDAPDLTPVLRLLALSLLIRGLGVLPEAELNKDLRFRALTLRSIVSTVVAAVVGVGCAVGGLGVYALVAQTLVQVIVATVIMWAAAQSPPRGRIDRVILRRLTKRSAQFFWVELGMVAVQQGDKFVVGAMLGPVALGYYVIAYRLLAVVSDSFTGVLSALALPVFTRLRDDRNKTLRALFQASKLSLVGASLIFLSLFTLAPVLIPLVFGDHWEPSVILLQVFCVAGVVNALTYFDRAVLYAADRPRLEAMVVAVAGVGTVTAALIGAQFSLTAVAIAMTLRSYMTWPLRLYVLRVAVGLDVRAILRHWTPPAMAGVAFGLAAYAVSRGLAGGPATLQLAAAAAAGCAAYIAWLWWRDRAFVTETAGLLPDRLARRRPRQTSG